MLLYTQKAIDPGLVYENFVQEYFKIWRNISQTLGSVIHKNASCPMKLATKDINYPSMTVEVVAGESFVVSFPRSVTNVGRANSTYVAHIEGDRSKLQVSVEPNTLQFTTMNQKKKFMFIFLISLTFACPEFFC
ncbi:putative cucumisin [Helianthus annuus]|nr:putative cucumisin [Helianthus annuus]